MQIVRFLFFVKTFYFQTLDILLAIMYNEIVKYTMG